MTTTRALPTEAMYTDDHAEQPTEPVAADRLPTVPPTDPHQSTEVRTGTPLGSGYLLDTVIGSGATGRVWRGRRRDSGAPVAVKLLREEFTHDQEAVVRFLRQRTALRTLDHPHLVKVHDLVTEGDVLAVVMDLVDGEDVRQALRQHLLRPSQAMMLLEQVAGALAAVHAAGVVHRDVKPENVLVQWRGGEPYALLTDFGLAGLTTGPTDITRMSMLMGTPAYVAPELVTGRPAVPATDVYALGVMAYELLTGQRPYQAANTAALLHAHVEAEPDRPRQLPEPVWGLLRAMLAKSPEARPPAAAASAEFGRLRAADPLPPPVPPPPPPPLPGPPRPAPVAPLAGPVLSLPTPPPPHPDDVSAPPVPIGAESAVALPTTGATRPAPAPPAAPARRRRWGWLVTAAGSVAVLGTALGIYIGQEDTASPPPAGPVEPPPQSYYVDTYVATSARGQAALRWDEGVELVDGFRTYAVFRRDEPDSLLISGPEQPYLIAGLDQDTEYCWYVVAIVHSHSPPAPQYASLTDDKLACVTPNGNPETP